jgi:hypothetical protein
MNATIENGILTIKMPVNSSPTPSTSGKTLLVATSHGIMATTAQVNGKPVKISVNAMIDR